MDKRIEKTRQALEDALFELCSAKTAEEITVSELCKKAGVNRTTFYKYYSVPEDILLQFQNRVFHDQAESFSSAFAAKGRAEHVDAGTRKELLLQHLTDSLWEVRNHKQAYQYFLKKGSIQSDLMEQFLSVLGPSLKNPERCYFLSGGMSALVSRWVKENCPGNPRQLAERIYWYMEKIK